MFFNENTTARNVETVRASDDARLAWVFVEWVIRPRRTDRQCRISTHAPPRVKNLRSRGARVPLAAILLQLPQRKKMHERDIAGGREAAPLGERFSLFCSGLSD